MDLYSLYMLLICFAAGIGWLVLLAFICGKWPVKKTKENKDD